MFILSSLKSYPKRKFTTSFLSFSAASCRGIFPSSFLSINLFSINFKAILKDPTFPPLHKLCKLILLLKLSLSTFFSIYSKHLIDEKLSAVRKRFSKLVTLSATCFNPSTKSNLIIWSITLLPAAPTYISSLTSLRHFINEAFFTSSVALSDERTNSKSLPSSSYPHIYLITASIVSLLTSFLTIKSKIDSLSSYFVKSSSSLLSISREAKCFMKYGLDFKIAMCNGLSPLESACTNRFLLKLFRLIDLFKNSEVAISSSIHSAK